jgi:hypothetical protein
MLGTLRIALLTTIRFQDSKNPLNVSPANQEVSQPRSAQEGGAAGSKGETGQGREERARTSGGTKA